MIQIGGSIHQVLMDALSKLEGKCGEEGYIKRGSIRIFSNSCGMIKGPNVLIQVVFECQISNPIPNQEFECIVEHNTRAGIKARLREKGDSPFVVFLARDHHYMIPNFSDIKENEIIRIKVLGQRFEIHDPKISIIGLLIPKSMEPEPIESENESENVFDRTITPPFGERSYSPQYIPTGGGTDILVFASTTGADKLPGKGNHEHVSKEYLDLSKIVKWRQQLSPFDVREFACNGSPEHDIVFNDAKWNTLEHFTQACKIYSKDPELARSFCVGGKNGRSAHNLEAKCKELKSDNWDSIQEEIVYIGAKAKFEQHPSYMVLLKATAPAQLMYSLHGDLIRCGHYEKLRDE
jgi:predicted NAD-dependent protein-ADP-ribosyltransferase YbiA (DUF1768 family)